MSTTEISTKSGGDAAMKKAQKSFGFVMFTFEVEHGINEKGAKKKMHKSTAEALAVHKIGTWKDIPVSE